MSAPQHDSAYSWLRLSMSLGLSVVGSAGLWATVVVLPDMQAEFGASRASASLPYALTMSGFAAGNLFMGRAVDRWSITPVLAVSALVLASGFALSAAAHSIASLTLLHLLLGVGAAASFAPLIADVSQWFRRRRGIAVAAVASGNYLAGTVWPPFIAAAMVDHGWRGAYLGLAVLVVTVLLPGSLLLRRRIDASSTARAAADAASRAESISLSPRSLQALLALAGVGCCIAMSMPQAHVVALCIDRGFGARAGAEMLSLMLAGGAVSRIGFGAFADRFGGLMALFVGGALQMLALCLFLLQGGLASLYLVALAFGLAQGGIVPSYAITVREFMPPLEAGRRIGTVISATIVGMALGGWMSGWLHDQSGSYALAIWNGIAWNGLNVGIALLLLSRAGPRRPVTAGAG